MARPHYVDTAELAKLLGVAPADPRLERVAGTVDAVVNAYYGAATVTAKLPDPVPPDDVYPPWPPAVVEAALTIGADVWRRPTTPGGVFQVVDYVGRLANDPASSVATLLDSLGRLEWGVA